MEFFAKFFHADPDDSMRPQLDRMRVRHLYSQKGPAQTTGLISAGIFVFANHDILPTFTLALWLVAFLVVFTLRALLLRSFVRQHGLDESIFNPGLWEKRFAFGVFASGVLWGIGGTLIASTHSLRHETFLAFLLAGTTAGAAVAYCTSLVTILAFVIPSFLPLALELAFEWSGIQICMSVLIFLYVALFLRLSIRTNDTILEAFKLRFRNDDLLEELRRSQSRIVYAAKMTALGEMSNGLAHEINNPLGVIFGTHRQLENKFKNDEELQRSLQRLGRAAERISKVVKGLRAFSRNETEIDLELLPVRKIISDALDFSRERFQNSGIRFTILEDAEEIYLMCRGTQLSQAILHLLHNSFEALRDNKDGRIEINMTADPNNIIISITDNGCGIAPAIRDKIMQPFFSTKGVGDGTGLGLSIASGIIVAHAGTLTLDPRTDQTQFVITLPRNRRP